MKGFKYQITFCELLSKVKSSDLIEYSTVYLYNSIQQSKLFRDLAINIFETSVLMK